MSGPDKTNEIEQLLSQARPAGPSPQLKQRVTDAAREAWNQRPADICWLIPLRRLAVSAVAAVLVVSLTNLVVDHSLVRWRAGGLCVSRPQFTEADDMPEAVYDLRLRRLLAATNRVSGVDLRDYQEQMQRMLDEAQEGEAAEPCDSLNGRSRWLGTPPHSGTFS